MRERENEHKISIILKISKIAISTKIPQRTTRHEKEVRMKVQLGILFSMCLGDALQILLQLNRSSGRKVKKKISI